MTIAIGNLYANDILNCMLLGGSPSVSPFGLGLFSTTSLGNNFRLDLRTGSAPAIGSALTGTSLYAGPISTAVENGAVGLAYLPPVNGVRKSIRKQSQNNGAANGTAGYFRITDVGNAVAAAQGTVSAIGGGGDMVLSTLSITTGAKFFVEDFGIATAKAFGNVRISTSLANWLAVMLTSDELGWPLPGAQTPMWYLGTISVYSGSPPSSADSAPTGTLLAQYTENTAALSSVFGTPSGGVISLVTLDFTPVASGTVGYIRFRCIDAAGGDLILQFNSVGTSGTDVIVSDAATTAGVTWSITSLALGF